MTSKTPGLYCRKLKTKTSWFTQIDGKYTPLGDNEEAARKKLDDLLGRNTTDTIEFMCRDYIREQRALIEAGDPNALAVGTVNNYEMSFDKQIIPHFGSMRPAEFKSSFAAQYLDKARKAKPSRAVAANRDLAGLASAFNHGMVLGMVETNPCRGVRRNKERPRTRKVAIAELNAFLQLAKGLGGSAYMTALIGALVAISGRRRAEIRCLTVTAIKDDGVHCKAAKIKAGETGRDYVIQWSPLVRQLIAEAQAIPRGVKSLFLFPNIDGQPYKDTGFKTLWNRLMHAYVKAGGEWFRAHDLRALYVSELLSRGDNPNTHQNEETMRRVYDRRAQVKVKPIDG